ncbi:MAG: tetratricopeptide repeat protein [Planctomycetes bacterium]|jgi:tetratricopeptide (TPR) repeat protein|nr:tetratricopeptide repeat protein [Planctomycetota bacterium]
MAIKVRRRRRLLIIVASAALIVVMAGIAVVYRRHQLASRIADARVQGIEAVQEGRYAEAVPDLSYYLAKHDEDTEALWAFAVALEHVAESEGNVKHLRTAVACLRQLNLLNPDDQKVATKLLDLYSDMYMDAEAVVLADRVLRRDPEDDAARRAKALAVLRLDQLDQPEHAQFISEYVAWPPMTFEGQLVAMQVRLGLDQDPASCVTAAEVYLRSMPDDPGARWLAAYAQMLSGRDAQALSHLREGTQHALDPDLTIRYATLLEHLRRYEEAHALLSASPHRDKRAIQVALAYRQWESARLNELQLLASNQDPASPACDAAITALHALALLATDQPAEAASLIDVLRTREDDHARAWVGVLEVMARDTLDPAALAEACETATILQPRDHGYFQFLWGEAHAQRGELEVALEHWRLSAIFSRGWPAPVQRHAEASLALNRYAEALGSVIELRRRDAPTRAMNVLFARAWIAYIQDELRPGTADALARLIGQTVAGLQPQLADAAEPAAALQAYLDEHEPRLAIRLAEIGGTRGIDAPAIVHAAATYLALSELRAHNPGDAELLGTWLSWSAWLGRDQAANQAVAAWVGRDTPPPADDLRRIGMQTRELGLAAAQRCETALEEHYGQDVASTLAKVTRLLDEGKDDQALSLVEQALAQPNEDADWRLAMLRARILERRDPGDGLDAWQAALRRHEQAGGLAREALASATVRADPGVSELALRVLKGALGEDASPFRIARARVRAQRATTHEQIAEATAILEDVVEQAPSDRGARQALAAMYERAGAYTKAQNHVEALLAIDPDDSQALLMLARCRVGLNDTGGALASLRRITERGRIDAGVADRASWLARRLGDDRLAADLLAPDRFAGPPAPALQVRRFAAMARQQSDRQLAGRASSLLPEATDPRTRVRFAIAALHAGRPMTAAALAQPLEAASSPDALLALGQWHAATGRSEQAVTSLRAAIAAAPDHADPHAALVRILIELRRYDEAAKALDAAAEAGHGGAWAALANATLVIRDPGATPQAMQDAATELERWLQITPDWAEARLVRAELAHRAGDDAAALAMLAMLPAADTTETGIALRVIDLLALLGEVSAAEDRLTRLVSLARGRALPERTTIAHAADRFGMASEALGLLEAGDRPITAESPADSATLYADLLAATGRTADARALSRDMLEQPELEKVQAASRVLASIGETTEAAGRLTRLSADRQVRSMALARYHRARGELKEAIAHYEAALDADSQELDAWQGLVGTRIALGENDAALEACRRALQTLRPPTLSARIIRRLQALNDDDHQRAHLPLAFSLITSDEDADAVVEMAAWMSGDASSAGAADGNADRIVELAHRHPRSRPVQQLALHLLVAQGQRAAAVGVARSAMRMIPTDPLIARRATEVFTQEDQWDQAVIAARRWRVTAHGQFDQALYYEALALVESGRADEAVTLLESFAGGGDSDAEHDANRTALVARALAFSGRADVAAELLEPYLSQSARWRVTWIHVARQGLAQDPATAEAWLDHVEPLIPADAVGERLFFAQQCAELGSMHEDPALLGKARDAIAGLVALDPPPLSAVLLDGMIGEKLGDAPAAIAAYRRVLRLAPDRHDAAHRLARALLRSDGDAAEALRLAQQAATAAPDNADYQQTLAKGLLAAGQAQEAIRAAEHAIEADPRNPARRVSLAEALAQAGEADAARAMLDAAQDAWRDGTEVPLEVRQRVHRLRNDLSREP